MEEFVGAVTVFGAGVDAARWRAVGRAARPGIGFLRTLRGRSETGAPDRPLAVLTVSVAGHRRFEPVRLGVLVPAAGRDVKLLKGRTRRDEFGPLTSGLAGSRRLAESEEQALSSSNRMNTAEKHVYVLARVVPSRTRFLIPTA